MRCAPRTAAPEAAAAPPLATRRVAAARRSGRLPPPPRAYRDGAAAAGAPAPPAPRANWLRGEDLRHPLDQQNTELLRRLPGLDFVARSLVGPAAEQALLMDNLASSVLVGPDQLPGLHALLVEAAAALGMPSAPDLYVRQAASPNAYTLAIAGQRPFVVVHTALLELLEPAEVQAVLAHELGHLLMDHGVWLTAANAIALGAAALLPAASGAVGDALARWSRAAELSCDRAALVVAREPRVVAAALMKLAGGAPAAAKYGGLSVDAFLRQARDYDEQAASPLGWYLRGEMTRGLSHPLPVLRAREVDRWAASAQYRGLAARGAGGGGGARGGGGGAAAGGAGGAAASRGGVP